MPLARAEGHFRHARRVRVVEHVDFLAGDALEQRVGVGAYPAFVDVGGAVDDAAPHHRRKGAADVALIVEVFDDFFDRFSHGLRARGLRRGDAVAVGEQFAFFGVDERALDARTADVDTEKGRGLFACHSVKCSRLPVDLRRSLLA